MDAQELDNIRLEDIDFFAKKYSELFGEHFDKNTPEEKEEFYNEIKKELLIKAPKYVITNNVDDIGWQNLAVSEIKQIQFTKGSIDQKETRIHELFHSYNRFLKKEDSNVIEKSINIHFLDEGITEMFARKMCGPEVESHSYPGEVEICRYLTSVIGERNMIRASHGNPEILFEETDRVLKTKDFIKRINNMHNIHDGIIQKTLGKGSNGYGTVSNAEKIMANLALDTKLIQEDIPTIIVDAVRKTEDPTLYKNVGDLEKTGEVYTPRLLKNNKEDSFEYQENSKIETLASMEQKILKAEIEKLSKPKKLTPKDIMKIEIKKSVYDRIDYQKHFVEHEFPDSEIFANSVEDREFEENFKSELDGESKRLGRRLTGFATITENAPFLVNRENIDKVKKYTFDFKGIKTNKLECFAEKLNIEKQIELLNEKKDNYIYEKYFSIKFPNEDETSFKSIMNELRAELNERNKGLIDKYKLLENEKTENEDELINNIIADTINEEVIDQEEVNQEEINYPEKQETQKEMPIEEKNDNNDLWMSRFKNWYSFIDKAPETAKDKFIKMKSDIVKTIKAAIIGKNIERQDKTNEYEK